MRKDVAVYISDVMGKHLQFSREFALQALQNGDNVHLILCDGDLRVCPAKNNSEVPPCILCKSRLKRVLNRDFGYSVTRYTLNLNKYSNLIELPEFNSIGELKQYRPDGVDHGLAAASTIISRLRDPKPDTLKHKQLVRDSLFTSIATYYEVTRLIKELGIDILHVQNGRRASQRPALRAGQNEGITVYVGEDGHSSSDCYITTENTYPHDIDYLKKQIEHYCNGKKQNKVQENGQKFYFDRRFGSKTAIGEACYTERQRAGMLPSSLNTKHHNIAIFNSSEDEFAAIEGYENPVYSDQIEALRCILEDKNINRDVKFFLRVHPNLATRKNEQTRMIEALDDRNVTVIPATSNVDTYALMEVCDTVLTFGSTMGIESAYHGKPSILVGRAPFEDLGSCYTPTSHSEVIKLLNDRSLAPLDNHGAVKFGHYMIARDQKYLHTINNKEKNNNSYLHPSRFATYWSILKYKGVYTLSKHLLRRIALKASNWYSRHCTQTFI